LSASEADLERVRLLLLEAAQNAEAWPRALTAFAEACGGFSGQLIARDGSDGLLFHLLTNVEPHTADVGEASGLGDLARNPRLRIGHRAPTMQPVAEQDFVSDDVRRKYAIYPEFFERYDLAFNTQAVLFRDDQALVRASVTRGKRQGPWAPEDLQVFVSLLPYVQAAARQQFLAERRSIEALIAGADAADTALFVLNRFGWLVGASREAERLLRTETFFRLKGGAVRATAASQDAALQASIARGQAAWAGAPFAPVSSIMLTNDRTAGNLQIKVVTLPPKDFSLSAEPAILVLGEGRPAELDRDALRQGYRLSPAEIDVVQSLRLGLSPAQIAEQREVSIGTVRMQLKSIFRKVGVSRQSELVARLRG
jgi:DNA-binding CsgD family transcriptional regulator